MNTVSKDMLKCKCVFCVCGSASSQEFILSAGWQQLSELKSGIRAV